MRVVFLYTLQEKLRFRHLHNGKLVLHPRKDKTSCGRPARGSDQSPRARRPGPEKTDEIVTRTSHPRTAPEPRVSDTGLFRNSGWPSSRLADTISELRAYEPAVPLGLGPVLAQCFVVRASRADREHFQGRSARNQRPRPAAPVPVRFTERPDAKQAVPGGRGGRALLGAGRIRSIERISREDDFTGDAMGRPRNGATRGRGPDRTTPSCPHVE